MTIFVTVFENIFYYLTSNKLFDIPLLVWLILPTVVAFIINFIQGKK